MALRLGPLRIPWLGKGSRDPSTRLRASDPYWDFFINTPPADLANSVPEMIRRAPEGNVFPTKADIHTPEITSSHVKEMARYLGANLVGIARLDSNDGRSSFPLPRERLWQRSVHGSTGSPRTDEDTPQFNHQAVRSFDELRTGSEPVEGRTADCDTVFEGKGEGDERYPFAVVCAVRADYDPREAPGIGGQVPVQNGLFITFVLCAWIRELGFRATVSPEPNAERLAAAAGLGKLDPDGRLVTPEYGTRVHVANVICTDLPLAADG